MVMGKINELRARFSKGAPDNSDIVKESLQQLTDVGTILDASIGTKYTPDGGKTYKIVTTSDFSRDNLVKLGLIEKQTFTIEPDTSPVRIFTVDQKSIEAALTKVHNVKFPLDKSVLKKKKPVQDTQLIADTLNQNCGEQGAVLKVELQRGRSSEEGTYVLQASNDFSRDNLNNLGLIQGTDYTKEGTDNPSLMLFKVSKKPLEEALQKKYQLNFQVKTEAIQLSSVN